MPTRGPAIVIAFIEQLEPTGFVALMAALVAGSFVGGLMLGTRYGAYLERSLQKRIEKANATRSSTDALH